MHFKGREHFSVTASAINDHRSNAASQSLHNAFKPKARCFKCKLDQHLFAKCPLRNARQVNSEAATQPSRVNACVTVTVYNLCIICIFVCIHMHSS